MNQPVFRQGRAFFAATIASLLLGAFSADAVETSTVTVEIIGGGTVRPNYNGLALTNGTKYSMTARPKAGFAFTGWSGSQTSTKPKLTFTNAPGLSFTATFVDRQKPVLKISPVLGKNALISDSLIVAGTTRDNDAVTNVLCRLNGADWTNAPTLNGWSNWWFTATLDPGTNFLEAYAVDASGNVSKTNKIRLIYTVTPASLAGYTLTATKPDSSEVTFDFADKTFTETTGVGSYTYKKLSSINGRLVLTYSAPPSANDPTNDASIVLQFSSATEGTFTDADGDNTFILSPANGWAPPSLTGSSIEFVYDDGIHKSAIDFPEPPTVVEGAGSQFINPWEIPLDTDYPGQIGDRVKVTFTRERYISQVNAWYTSTEIFAGAVIEIGDSSVTVLFDSAPKPSPSNFYTPQADTPLDITSYTYSDYANEVPTTNGYGTFTFTNTSPDGGLLKLNQAGQNKFVVMYFNSDSPSGTFYEEDYSSTNLIGTSSGTFGIILPPQISTQPQSLVATNGGTASFTVKASGTPPLGYQWQFNGTNLTDGTNLWGSIVSGSATTNLVITGVSSNDVGNYRAVVTNSLGSATSSAASLSLQPIPQSPQITSQPDSTLTVTNGDAASFSVTATGTTPLTYQWQYLGTAPVNAGTNLVNSAPYSGVTTTNLLINPATTNEIGYYQVVITNLYGSVTSTPPSYLNVVTP